MTSWVKVFSVKGFQVCCETGFEAGMPAIIFRMQKDGGMLRSKMCLQPEDDTQEARRMAVLQRDVIFDEMDSTLAEGAVEAMLELEPELMDGSVHGFVMEGNKG